MYLAQKSANDELPFEAKLVALHADREQAKHLLSRWRSLESELNAVVKDEGSTEKAELAIRESLDHVFQQIALSPNVQAALPTNRRSILNDKTTENAKRIEQTRDLSRGRGISRTGWWIRDRVDASTPAFGERNLMACTRSTIGYPN